MTNGQELRLAMTNGKELRLAMTNGQSERTIYLATTLVKATTPALGLYRQINELFLDSNIYFTTVTL